MNYRKNIENSLLFALIWLTHAVTLTLSISISSRADGKVYNIIGVGYISFCMCLSKLNNIT